MLNVQVIELILELNIFLFDLSIKPTGVDLCMECLASRVELGQHRATHKYRLVDNGGLQLLGRFVLIYKGTCLIGFICFGKIYGLVVAFTHISNNFDCI